MPPEQDFPPSSDASVKPLPPPKSARRHLPHLTMWIVLVGVLLILIGVAVSLFKREDVKGPQTRAVMQAKQIGQALKSFAADHEGSYPRAGLPDMLGAEVNNSNAAFAVLFPEFVTSESLFGNPLSAYQTRPPDNIFDQSYTGKPVKTLEPGENVYGYVAGLTDKPDPYTPLIVDGTDGTGHYTTDTKKRGGLWEGKKALVIYTDNSGVFESLVGPGDARYIPRHAGGTGDDKGNLLNVSGLGPDVRLLDPAVGHR